MTDRRVMVTAYAGYDDNGDDSLSLSQGLTARSPQTKPLAMVAANAVSNPSLFVASILGRLHGSPDLHEVVFTDIEGQEIQIEHLFGLIKKNLHRLLVPVNVEASKDTIQRIQQAGDWLSHWLAAFSF